MKHKFFLGYLALFHALISIGQSITNVIAVQKDNLVELTYNLECEYYADISIYYCEKAGEEFKGPLLNVYGDVGSNIEPGERKIIWDVLNEIDFLVGSEIYFRINALINFGKIKDSRNDKVYKTVIIGNQIWMAENLASSSRSYITRTYNNEDINSSTYGYMYNWRGALEMCPKGWYLPSKDDFASLVSYFNDNNLNPSQALQFTGNSGFSAYLAGWFGDGKFYDFNNKTYFWTATKQDGFLAWAFKIDYKDATLNVVDKEYSLYVRCMKTINQFQNEWYSESDPIFCLIGNDTLPFYNKIPVQYFIKQYVEKNVMAWQQKGEFEKTIDYQKRVTEATRNQMIQHFNDEALVKMKEQYAKTIKWDELVVSAYDADNETYLVQSNEFGQFALPVPISDAPEFKKNWKLMKIENVDFYINDNLLKLAKFDAISLDGKIYKYDNNQITTYAASNIVYNFGPIEVRTIKDDNFQNSTKIENKSTTVGLSDIDINIPLNYDINSNTFAVIIANENYLREVPVQFAINDGKTFKEYCEKTLGVPPANIHFNKDATFGTMKSEIKWISDVIKAYNGDVKVIFYYAGHGMPDENDRSAYLLPIDGFSSDFETAINLDDLYNRLSATPSQNVTIILDACFSGSIRDDGMLANARSVKIKPKQNIVSGNMLVFCAATGDETAYPHTDKQHGLFTYYLLKKLQETKGDVNFGDLTNYVISNVKQQSIVINQKSQTPQINVSASLEGKWQQMKVK